jgi:3-hydroxybutyryl-CoA dehydrogenase
MNIVIITDDPLKAELLAQNAGMEATVEFCTDIPSGKKADCYIDLLYQWSPERVDQLDQLDSPLVIINAVMGNPGAHPMGFIRINGWPTFLKRPLVEAWSSDETMRKQVEEVFVCFGKKVEWIPTSTGFVTARVISMIINEAYYALDEKVSTKEEIDIAMKFGTNYPYGPFEWSQKIGLQNIYELLYSLSILEARYKPSPLLKQEALNA